MDDIDFRLALYNDQPTGPASQIQLPLERITTLHGLVWDLDPKLLIPGNAIFTPADDPKAFYPAIKVVLDRHPLARLAEVRVSGTGLHVILRLDPPVELKSAAAQKHWDSIVRALQCTLPADPNAPGITATTRAIGSVNSKNRARVELLEPGKAVPVPVVEAFLTRVAAAPFKEIGTILLGDGPIQPCPVCGQQNSHLDVLDWIGVCYANCNEVRLQQVLDRIYLPMNQENSSPGGSGTPGTTKARRKKRSPQKSN